LIEIRVVHSESICLMCVWTAQDDALQFFKEEIEEGVAVYNVYLKKVHYHTSLSDVSYSHDHNGLLT